MKILRQVLKQKWIYGRLFWMDFRDNDKLGKRKSHWRYKNAFQEIQPFQSSSDIGLLTDLMLIWKLDKIYLLKVPTPQFITCMTCSDIRFHWGLCPIEIKKDMYVSQTSSVYGPLFLLMMCFRGVFCRKRPGWYSMLWSSGDGSNNPHFSSCFPLPSKLEKHRTAFKSCTGQL